MSRSTIPLLAPQNPWPTMSKDFPHLLSPLRIGAKTVRNRVLVTAHVPGLAENQLPSERWIAYHRARAKGGAGLQLTGATPIHRTGSLDSAYCVHNIDDTVIPGYSRLAKAIHDEGGTFLVQLAHSAQTMQSSDLGRPMWAPSPVPSDLVREIPHAMTEEEIAEIVSAYGAAAARVREGGLDGVEILGAFGFLLTAFMSPKTNQRTDRYGGSLDNRLRFAFEVVDAVRAACGAQLIVGMRIPGDERTEGGLDGEDMQQIAQKLATTGKLDYLNVIAGTNSDRLMRWEHWPPTPAPHGLYVPLAAAIKTVVGIPVFTTGRITDPRLAEQIVREGKADMVGMTRAHIADPDIVRKITEGRADDIRPCIGANVCINRVQAGGALKCFHNPEAGREKDWGPAAPAGKPRRVAVIGAGPAGLEAARVAAGRGHRVTLYETGKAIGGQLRLWAKAPQTREFAKSLAWFERQLGLLQVRIETGKALMPADMAKLDADAVVIATGAEPVAPRAWPGAESSSIKVIDPYVLLEKPPKGVQHAVVRDDGWGRAALSAAELLCEQGTRVTLVTAEFMVAESVPAIIRTPLYKHLLGHGAEFRQTEKVVRLEGSDVVLENVYSGAESRVAGVDLLVDWSGPMMVETLASAARAAGKETHVVGDCVSPRAIEVAVAEGALVGREV